MLKLLKYSKDIEKNMFFPFYGKHTLKESGNSANQSMNSVGHYSTQRSGNITPATQLVTLLQGSCYST